MDELTKNNVLTAEITGYSSSGDGIARVNGRAVFVKGAIRGERCRIKILKANKTAVYAKTDEIIASSPERREPGCCSFSKCGGCHLMHMSYEEELYMKRQRVSDTLRRIGGIDIPVDEIVRADSTVNYRNKVIYAVGGSAGAPVLGFYRTRSHDIVPIDSCVLQPEAAQAAAVAVLRWMKNYSVEPYDERRHLGLVRHIFIRHGFATNQTAVCIVANGRFLPNTGALVDEIRAQCHSVRSIMLNCNTKNGNTVLSGTFERLWGSDTIEDTLCGLKFRLSPRSFYQINSAQAEKLYNKAAHMAGLNGGETVLDLYCGTGTITLHMARRAGAAIGAEIVEDAVKDAHMNAENNGINNVRFITADASQAALELEIDGVKPEVVVVDPPRKGLAPDVIETICRLAPEKVVYVSCDPATLARDLKLFGELSYVTRKVTPVDMFPRCAHVECVVLMSRTEK